MSPSHQINTVGREIRELLESKDYVKLVDLCRNDKKYFKALKFDLYHIDETISRPAIEVVGRLMKSQWDHGEQEKVRTYIGTLLWSLNDESGGIGWNSPQQLAEIIVRIPELADPYISMMIDRCITEPLLVENAMWAIGRLGEMSKSAVEFFSADILKTFNRKEPQILGTAAWAMGDTGFRPAIPILEPLKTKEAPARIYIDGVFTQKTVGEWASDALAKLTGDQ